MHTLLWVQRMFPGVFKNFVFITSGEIDSEAFANEEVFKKNIVRISIELLKVTVTSVLCMIYLLLAILVME